MIKPTEFGEFLRTKRKTAGLTQDDVAAAINKTGQYISNIENTVSGLESSKTVTVS